MEPRLVARVGVGATPIDSIPTWMLWAGLAGAAYRAVYGSPAPRRSAASRMLSSTQQRVSHAHFEEAHPYAGGVFELYRDGADWYAKTYYPTPPLAPRSIPRYAKRSTAVHMAEFDLDTRRYERRTGRKYTLSEMARNESKPRKRRTSGSRRNRRR